LNKTNPEQGKPALKALIFDVDGTLADTERHGHRVAFNRAFASFGLDWVWSEALYGELLRITGGKERIRHYLSGLPAETRRRLADLPIAEIHQLKTRYYAELVSQGGVALRPGILRLIKEAKEAGLKLAIATTTTMENIIALVQAGFGQAAHELFDVIAAGDMVASKKPAPDVYVLALEKLGLASNQCLAMEDSEVGLASATGAGIATVITLNDYTVGQDFSTATTVFDQLGEADNPCRCLSGVAPAGNCVDLESLRHIHRQARVPGWIRNGADPACP